MQTTPRSSQSAPSSDQPSRAKRFKVLAAGALACLAIGIGGVAATGAARESAARNAHRLLAPPSPGDTTIVDGPRTFTTPNGSQIVGVEVFSPTIQPGTRYLLQVVNGDAGGALRATAGSVSFNGSPILTTSDLASGPQTITKEVNLVARDTITVVISGPAGAHVVATILATADPTVTIFGPKTYIRPSGQSPVVVDTFTVPAGVGAPFTMYVANGDSLGNSRASSATLTLNGVSLLTTSDFNQQIGSIVRTITLTMTDILQTQVESSPGNRITTRIVGLDIAPPTLTITAPTPGTITKNTTVTVSGTFADQTAVKITVAGVVATLSSGTYSATVPLSNEGDNVIHVTAVDAAGNTTDSTRTVVRDTVPPLLTVAAPADGFVTRFDTVFVRGTVIDAHAVTVTANGVPLPVDGNGAFNGSVPLVEGSNFITVVATDAAGNTRTVTRGVTKDSAPPVVTLNGPADGTSTTAAAVTVSGSVQDATTTSVKVNGTAVTVGEGSFSVDVALTIGANTITIVATDAAGNASTVTRTVTRTSDQEQLPPDPATIAPPLDRTIVTPFSQAYAFLYNSPTPVQRGVAAGAISAQQAAVIRGRVIDRSGAPLSGATITVVGHPELGHTLSRTDGRYDLVVNGGSPVRLSYKKSGFLSAERAPATQWLDFTSVDDVALVPLDSVVTSVDFTAPLAVAQASAAHDGDGTRHAVMMFRQGTHATMVMPDGSTQPLSQIHVRATEYTVGKFGLAAMPATLPPSSAYTYAVELSADEALSASARSVQFDTPVPVYVENFLHFPVGYSVPVGYYDPTKGAWRTSTPAVVMKVLAINSGVADVVVDTSGHAATPAQLAALGIDDAERHAIGSTYAVNQTLWRTQVGHFSPFDFNPEMPDPDPGPDAACNWMCRAKNALNKLKHRVDKPCKKAGSVIDCNNRTLGEQIGIQGTPYALTYTSSRTSGDLEIPVTADSLPATLLGVELRVSAGGQLIVDQRFGPIPNQTYHVSWNGKDVYGRQMQGVTQLKIELGEISPKRWYMSPASARDFGVPCEVGFEAVAGLETVPRCIVPDSLLLASGDSSARGENIVWHDITIDRNDITVGAWDARSEKMGGWTLSVHHVLGQENGILYLGTGDETSSRGLSRAFGILTPVVGHGVACGSPTSASCAPGYADSVLASVATVNPQGITFGSDGTLYYADNISHKIRHVLSSGRVVTFAGNGDQDYSGDGGPATSAGLEPMGMAFAPDGSMYVADFGNHRIRKIDTTGTITTVVGTGDCGDSGDNGLASAASICFPQSIAVGPDGSLFINQTFRIRRVGPDGEIINYAGATAQCFMFSGNPCGEGGPAVNARFGAINAIALGPDGSVYALDASNDIIRRIRPDGTVITVAGKPTANLRGDGGAATLAQLRSPGDGLVVAADGSLYFDDGNTIRRVDLDGTITTAAGVTPSCDIACTTAATPIGNPARQQSLNSPDQLGLGPDGHVYITEVFGRRITRLEGPVPVLQVAGEIISSGDGATYFEFSGNRHVRTWDALTKRKLLEFTYDSTGLVRAITDGDGNVTTVERGPDGSATAIVSQDGDRTTLTNDGNGFLSSIANGAHETIHVTHNASGLLTNLVDAKGQEHKFTYTVLNEIKTDVAPDSTSTTVDTLGLYKTSQTTAEGRVTVRNVTYQPDGSTVRTNTTPDGLTSTTVTETNGRQTLTTPQGVTTTTVSTADPRFAMQAPFGRFVSIKMPSGATMTTTASRTVTLSNPLDPITLFRKIDSVSINGKVTVATFDAVARAITSVSPEGRTGITTLDSTGRPVSVQRPGMAAVTTGYDSRGRTSTVTQFGRTTRFAYGANGRLSQTTDPIGRTTGFTYDSAGRLLTTRRPDGQVLTYGYDVNGNRTSVTPPGRPAHLFTFTKGNLLSTYTAPAVNGVAPVTVFAYNRDRQLTRITRPDSGVIQQVYDTAGRPISYVRPDFTTTFQYSPTTGLLTRMATSGDGDMTYTYDGSLMKTITTTGVAATSMTLGYDTEFRVNSIGVLGNVAAFTFDRDGLMTQAGQLSIGRATATGQIVSTTLGTVRDSVTYDALGAISADTSRNGGSLLYGYGLQRDSLQRIVTKIESVDGVSMRFDYAYDSVSRLVQVKTNGSVTASYAYDPNGNRIGLTTPSGSITAQYDAQDRLVNYGSATFGYSAAGELVFRAIGSDTTHYRFDALSMLRGVTLSDGTRIDYTLDPMNRRVARSVNGTVVQRFAYTGTLAPAAEIDGSGNVLTRYVYGTHANVPDYMVQGGATYRLVTDGLGSVRTVVDISTGTAAQELDYDEFGRVTRDTHPGFQPFGYAGGMYDELTGLVHFGEREYDAATGRWTSKDPIGFAAGDANLYAYAQNNPLNVQDSDGRCPICFLIVPAAGGFAADVAFQLALNGGDLSCINWTEAGVATALGALGGLGELFEAVAATGRAVDRVIGHFPQYLQVGEAIGAKVFDLGEAYEALTAGERWAANVQFLDEGIAEGAEFVVSDLNPRAGSQFAREVDYLLSRGYHYASDGLSLVPIP